MAPLAFEDDVVNDFGIGQLASVIVAMVISLVRCCSPHPGRWYLPEGDYQRLELVDRSDRSHPVDRRPDVLPESGWRLSPDDLAVGVTGGHLPTVTQRCRLDGGSGWTRAAVRAPLGGRTSGSDSCSPGHPLRAADRQTAPEPFSSLGSPAPRGGAAFQTGLTRIGAGSPAVRVAGAWPLRSDITELDLPANGVPTLAGRILRSMRPRRCSAGPRDQPPASCPMVPTSRAVTADGDGRWSPGRARRIAAGCSGGPSGSGSTRDGSPRCRGTPRSPPVAAADPVVRLVVLIAMVVAADGSLPHGAAPGATGQRSRSSVRRAPESGPADRGAAAEERAVADHGEGAT